MADKFDLDAAMVRKLAALLEETGLNEIEYAEGERRIRLHRAPPVMAALHLPPGAAQTPPAPVATSAAAAPSPAEPAETGTPVISPMVGTAYLAAEPGGKPFVRVGDTVKAGDTLLIIEAMKVMNPVKAAVGGVVKQITVRDGAPVEYAEKLMVIG